MQLGRTCEVVAVSLLIRWRRSSQKPLPADCLIRGQLTDQGSSGSQASPPRHQCLLWVTHVLPAGETVMLSLSVSPAGPPSLPGAQPC